MHNDLAFLAFSHGPMNCVGKGFALQEIRTVVCALVQRFQVRFAEGKEAAPIVGEGWERRMWLRDLKDVFVSRMGKMPVVVTLRE